MHAQFPANSSNIIIHRICGSQQINKIDANFRHITKINDLTFKCYSYYMEIYNQEKRRQSLYTHETLTQNACNDSTIVTCEYLSNTIRITVV